jgi:hypothetical protein
VTTVIWIGLDGDDLVRYSIDRIGGVGPWASA